MGTQIRAWTMQDEGMDYLLDNMQSMAGINDLYMVVVMHKEHRPFRAPEFPHNPARDSWEAEDSRVTFFPEMSRYGNIKPQLSKHKWIRETDWLRLMVEAARARGLSTGAEVSHYPIPKALLKANPDWQMKTIDGTSWSEDRFCPNNPVVREYLIALYGDLAANYDLDYIQTCQRLFSHNEIDDGGTCFCTYCMAEAKATGFDLEAAIPILKKDKNAEPQKSQWLKFRRDSSTKLYRELSEKIKQENPACQLRLNDIWFWEGRDAIESGLDLNAVAPYLGSIVNQDHTEQKGRKNEGFALRKKWLSVNRDFLGPDKPLICGIAPRMDASPKLVKEGIKVALEHPAKINGLALKHYDGASFSLLRAFKQGMIDAGVQGLTPTLGKEIEEMELENYAKFSEELVEEWGVETKGTGKATYTFDNPSGLYDIRITYFDEEEGQSKVTLKVADQEKASFKMDEDVDCWRWRLFKNIQVNAGDPITLIGEADENEQAKLDFIEFIRR
ncbi:hypothetical protein [Novipirellula artificiosorum]|uniref:hypothetical protein n=1 Tax=Novipirellula artificiosorum TaxID=2528016 RepID=UPI001E5D43F6|nr:hypothetical protein [Novipirellula artificiosorum]